MVSRAVLAIVFALPAVQAAVLRGQKTVDADGMRPEVVAATLAHVEDDWKAEAAVFTMECNSTESDKDCQGAPAAFAKSCATVVSAVVTGSAGDKNVAKEYMADVCSQNALAGWHKLRCTDFATAIEKAMSADNYANRENMNSGKLCTGFWSKFVEEERKREAQEAEERAEREKKEAEEAAKAKAKAEADAKAEAERKAKEEAQHEKEEQEEKAQREAAEAKVRAAEAKAKAAEAAAKLAEKKAEAEKVAKAAQLKLEEAAQAEAEHKKLQEEHQKAEELLNNTTNGQAEPVVAVAETANVTTQEATNATEVSAPKETKTTEAEPAVAAEAAPVVAKAEEKKEEKPVEAKAEVAPVKAEEKKA